jgi:phage recombination protein Bet
MTEVATTQTPAAAPRASILAKMAGKYGVEPSRMLDTLKATAFKGGVTNEQMMALLIVADQHGLNPWTREIYAFPDKGGIVPVVGVDGWARIMNEHPMFDGIEFTSEEGACTATIYRKDRSHPIRVTEYLSECKRDTQPWKSHPQRLLRHKSMIQCARLAFGFAGIYDPDEAERVAVDMGDAEEVPRSIDVVRKAAASKREQPAEVVDAETGEIGGEVAATDEPAA